MLVFSHMCIFYVATNVTQLIFLRLNTKLAFLKLNEHILEVESFEEF